MRIAVLNAQNMVENIIEADENFAKAQGYPAYVLLSNGQWCSVGAAWNGSTFTPRDPEP